MLGTKTPVTEQRAPTLRSTRGDTVESPEGWSVQILGRVGIRYTEGTKVMLIESEVLAAPHGIVVWTRSLRAWEPPWSDEPVSDAARDRVITNLRAALAFWGSELELTP